MKEEYLEKINNLLVKADGATLKFLFSVVESYMKARRIIK